MSVVPWCDALAAEFDEAAANWRASAQKSRAEGGLSSMCGEDAVPSHVIATARAMSFEYAAKRVRESANSQPEPQP